MRNKLSYLNCLYNKINLYPAILAFILEKFTNSIQSG